MMKHTETIENIVKVMQTFHPYEDMPLSEQLAIAEDVKHEIETYDIFLHEYLTFRFDTLPQKERRKYLPISEYAWRLPKNVNAGWVSGKYNFNKKAKQFISRDFICFHDASWDDVQNFLRRHETVIAKPLHRQAGKGITVYHPAEWNLDDLCIRLLLRGTPLVEEYVQQHPGMAKFHPASLNTLRVTTFTDADGKIAYIAAFLKTGCGGSHTDNLTTGGITAPIDMKTGILSGDGINRTCHTFEKHPDTGAVFKGSVIPGFGKVMKMVGEYVGLFGALHFIGWDIAIKEDGDPELIEANPIPEMTPEQVFFGPFAETFRKLYGTTEYRSD